MSRAESSGIIDADSFAELAQIAVARLQRHFAQVDANPLTCHLPPPDVLKALRSRDVPQTPSSPKEVLNESLRLMLDYSLFTAHPRFLGYVCPAADPLGALAELIVAAVNPNAASAMMTPIGYVLETTVIRWLAQLIGMPSDADGILLSGGNEANLVGLLAAREHRAPWPVRTAGLQHADARKLYAYATAEVHAGLYKAMEIAGLGREALRVVPHDRQLRMDVGALRAAVRRDREAGAVPICVIASIGTIATGAIDPLEEIVELAKHENLWVHVDGSYGAAVAMLPNPPQDCRALSKVDSVSWDPHKWLRVPYEAGCVLLRDPHALRRTFGNKPTYYSCGGYEDVDHYYDKGPQNSRHLRALKVWMSLMQHGREGHVEMISRDLDLTRKFFEAVARAPSLQACSCNLCVATFRYVPDELRGQTSEPAVQDMLNKLNRSILDQIQLGGDSYISNAVVEGEFLLRACFVNYRTRDEDLPRVIDLVRDTGRELWARAAQI